MEIKEIIKEEFSLTQEHTDNIINLLDEGNTIPFIARYRKELTGHIDDQVLRKLADRLEYLRNLFKRREEVFKLISDQGKMTDEINDSIQKALTMTELEDIYRPFKPKKKTRATVAIAKGLQPLADIFLAQDENGEKPEVLAKDYINEELGVKTVADAINGAKDIIAEIVSDNADLRKKLRMFFIKLGVMKSSYAKGVNPDDANALIYEGYKDYEEPVSQIKSHRILAINRGEKEEILKVSLSIDSNFAKRVCEGFILKGNSPYREIIVDSISDSYDRLIEPSIEREVRNMFTESAQEKAIGTFETNLKPLLMQSPLKGKIVLGFDPGYRTGCKLAVVDETGKVLDKTVIFPTMGEEKRIEAAKIIVRNLIKKYNVDVVSIGNGTASKESEIFISDLIKEFGGKVSYIVVSEAGASVYSASELGAKEFPDYDVSERSAVSIARRLQDPLAELIKIDPKSIGVGQYQHDMPEARLDAVLDGVLEDCVNSVGVDLNTASPSLLKHVAGLNMAIANNIVDYRESNGKFRDRKELLKVSKLGEKAFIQCAGFLRISDGKNILDNTAVHPESYENAEKLLSLFGFTDDDVKMIKLGELPKKVAEYGREKVALYCDLGEDTLNDIVSELIKPGRDVRDSLPKPILRSDLLSISDLKEGMIINGTVRNVTDFGAFVDISVHQDGLVHISQLSDKYITSPSEVVKVGQQVKVKILSVDLKKNRIALTMKDIPND